MHVLAPQESQPDIGIKEIQGVHRCVRWSTLTFGPSETTSGNRTLFGRGLWPCKRTVLTPRGRVHGPSNLWRPLAALPCGKEAVEYQPWYERIPLSWSDYCLFAINMTHTFSVDNRPAAPA
jgi:hypothetical protein